MYIFLKYIPRDPPPIFLIGKYYIPVPNNQVDTRYPEDKSICRSTRRRNLRFEFHGRCARTRSTHTHTHTRTRGNWIEIGQTWRRKSVLLLRFRTLSTLGGRTGIQVKVYIYVHTSRLYRRESWNCSIKQSLGSAQQISPATRVYPVIVGVSPRGFPAILSSLVLRETPSFRRESIEIGIVFLFFSREKWLKIWLVYG